MKDNMSITAYKQLNELIETVSKTADDFKRYYRIGEDKVFVLSTDLYQAINRSRRARGEKHLLHRVSNGRAVHDVPSVYQSVVSDKNEGLDFCELAPKEILHLAEYRAIVDNWIKGELLELPPSNCAAPKRDDKE